MSAQEKPGRRPPPRYWYVVAALIFVSGFVAMALFMVPRLTALSDGLERFVAPGEHRLVVEEPGRYTVFFERRSVFDGEIFASESVAGLRLVVTDLASGEEIPLLPVNAGLNYDVGAYSGSALLALEIDSPGAYGMAAEYVSGAVAPRVVLSVGREFAAAFLSTLFGALGLALLGAVVGGGVFLRVLLRRRAALAAETT